MKRLLSINPGFYGAALFVSLLVAGAFMGGFGTTQANGSTV